MLIEWTAEQKQHVREIVETWAVKRYDVKTFDRIDLDKWASVMNYHTKQLISITQWRDPALFQELGRLANEANGFFARSKEFSTSVTRYEVHDLIRYMEVTGANKDEFFSALTELCVHAPTLLTDARLFVNGRDITKGL